MGIPRGTRTANSNSQRHETDGHRALFHNAPPSAVEVGGIIIVSSRRAVKETEPGEAKQMIVDGDDISVQLISIDCLLPCCFIQCVDRYASFYCDC